MDVPWQQKRGSAGLAIPPPTCWFAVGTAGFEPATSASRTLRAAKLRYVPKGLSLADLFFGARSGFRLGLGSGGGGLGRRLALLFGGQEGLGRAAEGAGV